MNKRCECTKTLKDIKKILKNFDDMVSGELTEVSTITGNEKCSRIPTLEDKLDFIKEEWASTKCDLNEIGFDIE